MLTAIKKHIIPFVLAVIFITGLLILLLYLYQNHKQVDCIIGIDVNPSIELSIDQNEKVVNVNAVNEDAEILLANLKIKGTNIWEAINIIFDAILEKGYVNDKANSVLVTVEGADSEKSLVISDKVSDIIDSKLSDNNIESAIIKQVLNADSAENQLASENGISVGKAALIEKIIQIDPSQNFSELAKLSINDLNLIANSNKSVVENITVSGSPSEKAYIGNDAALQLYHTKILLL